MNPLAQELNDLIRKENSHVYEMLSTLGRQLFFPRGILAQSAEAKVKAKRFNATIGMATEDGHAMYLPSVMGALCNLSPDEALTYAPATGNMELRKAWKANQEEHNPSMRGKPACLPVVTCGLTHGLSLVGDLFVEPGDVMLLPDMLWGNYRLIYELRRGARIRTFPFFAGDGFNLDGFAKLLQEECSRRAKVIVLMNFPNNPTGYSPTTAEAQKIAELLLSAAERNTNVVAITDDAYFGLFFDENTFKESLFGLLAGEHPKLMAIKLDAATKEHYVWGLRVGFITLSVGGVGAESPLFSALEKKLAGAIRSGISNCSQLSQAIVLRALKSPTLAAERAQKFQIMANRVAKVREVLKNPKFANAWEPYPFNSGYFMCLRLKNVNAERLRLHMLDKYGIGVISLGERDIRVAFSCVEVEQIEELFATLYQGVCDLQASSTG